MTHPYRTIETLVRDPLFQLSLPDQDAFHSNMLAWLIRVHRAAAYPLATITPAFLGSIVERNWRGLDLFVDEDMGSHKLALINRVNSVPSADRLDSIAQNVRHPITVHLLFSLIPPLEPIPEPWMHVDYAELAEPLRESVEILRATGDASSADIVGAYLTLVERLVTAREDIERMLAFDEPVDFDEILRDRATRSGVTSLVESLRIKLLVERICRQTGHAVTVDLSSPNGSAQLLFPTRTGHKLGWRMWKGELQLIVALAAGSFPSWRGRRSAREEFVKRHFSDFLTPDVRNGRTSDWFLHSLSRNTNWKSREPNVVFSACRIPTAAPPSALTAACIDITEHARRIAADSAI
ncbi:hypothetical protein [Prescottella equi]|uniref:hypothetical protein n=1 Tax=Rhodococcus hoagii TaxID=43767 RepID=UPI0007CD849C|nr:hypothetical protein [Prescottella equi]